MPGKLTRRVAAIRLIGPTASSRGATPICRPRSCRLFPPLADGLTIAPDIVRAIQAWSVTCEDSELASSDTYVIVDTVETERLP